MKGKFQIFVWDWDWDLNLNLDHKTFKQTKLAIKSLKLVKVSRDAARFSNPGGQAVMW